MENIANLDVLIVYAQTIAKSAADSTSKTPFPKGSRNESYNIVYGYFLEICGRNGLKAAFTTSADIIGPGICKSYWSYKNKRWVRVNNPCYSPLIFDKFSPIRKSITARRKLLFSSPGVKPFNDPVLFELFFDKQKTFDLLSGFAIPTISITERTAESVGEAMKALTKLMKSHVGAKDFNNDIVMKDRFGAGGRHVYKFKSGQNEEMLKVIKRNVRVSYIIQPFAKFDQGFRYKNSIASTDIRLVYLQGKIFQTYIRVAKPGEFRCNEHQGGLLTYLTTEDIPKKLIAKSNLIAKMLNKGGSLFALDFLICNSGNSYLLEGNTGPGLDWNMALKKNEIAAKKLIRKVVAELSARVKPEVIYQPIFDVYSPVYSAPQTGLPVVA